MGNLCSTTDRKDGVSESPVLAVPIEKKVSSKLI